MNEKQVNFKNKKILIYGFGKSGTACFKFLKRNNICTIFDDKKKNIPPYFKKYLINIRKLSSTAFYFIVLSPGIDINRCIISNYLRKNRSKIISELDIFEICYPNINKITITGTNGKSTTSKLLHDLLKNNKMDVRLTGKRVFMMAPIHHHFEKKGWPESTIVIRFWIIAIILALIGLATLKLR